MICGVERLWGVEYWDVMEGGDGDAPDALTRDTPFGTRVDEGIEAVAR